MRIHLCIRRLALLWFSGAGLLFMLLFIQSILGRYGERTSEVWDWFASVLLPVLTLIAGAFFYGRSRASTRSDAVTPHVYYITLGMSITYLFVVNVAVLFSPFSPIPPLELLETSKLALEVFQGALMTALGVFFVSKGAQQPASTAVGHN